uniref:Metalloendopeptidase n=1 Tax=Myxobolus squamalis TaxID=59785 RepID=A0A6B2G391_MYXSQ
MLGIGEQDFSLSSDCLHNGPILHELMHSIGFIHEHSRCDRDKFVKINISNIKIGFVKNNFSKRDCKSNEFYNLPYDYKSIMHYKGHEFSINPYFPTIFHINKSKSALGNDHLSRIDIQKLLRAYNCPDSKILNR